MGIINILNGTINFNKIADDYSRNDKSYAASYLRHHVKPSLNLGIALYLGIVAIGVGISVVSSLKNSNKNQDSRRDSRNNKQNRSGIKVNKVPFKSAA